MTGQFVEPERLLGPIKGQLFRAVDVVEECEVEQKQHHPRESTCAQPKQGVSRSSEGPRAEAPVTTQETQEGGSRPSRRLPPS